MDLPHFRRAIGEQALEQLHRRRYDDRDIPVLRRQTLPLRVFVFVLTIWDIECRMMFEDCVFPKHLAILSGRLIDDARVGQCNNDTP